MREEAEQAERVAAATLARDDGRLAPVRLEAEAVAMPIEAIAASPPEAPLSVLSTPPSSPEVASEPMASASTAPMASEPPAMAPAVVAPARPAPAPATRPASISATAVASRRGPPAEAVASAPPPANAPVRKPEPRAVAATQPVQAPVRVDVPTATVTAATPPASPRIGQRDANRLLGDFSRAYEQGDLQQMRELFASEDRGQRGSVSEVLDDYRRVFDNSRERSLMVRDVNWFQDGENITIVAGYEASVTSRGGKERRTRGDIRLDLRRESDSWRIYRVRRDERRG
jgi:hypothetical protein